MVLIPMVTKVTFPAADMETMKVILRILRILRVEPKRLKTSYTPWLDRDARQHP